MTLIRCKKAPAVNPYVVVATQMVKGCPKYTTTEPDNCRECDAYVREQD